MPEASLPSAASPPLEHVLHSSGTDRPLPLSSPPRAPAGFWALGLLSPSSALPKPGLCRLAPVLFIALLCAASFLTEPWAAETTASLPCHVPAAGGASGTLTPLTCAQGCRVCSGARPSCAHHQGGALGFRACRQLIPATPTSGHSCGAVGTKSNHEAPTLTLWPPEASVSRGPRLPQAEVGRIRDSCCHLPPGGQHRHPGCAASPECHSMRRCPVARSGWTASREAA